MLQRDNIPLVDLNAQYLSIKGEIDNAISNCVTEGNFIKGPAVTDFEVAFSNYLGADHCVGCGNGTDALELIMRALNIGPGDEVIVPALTWIATAEAVSNVGAKPVFVDIDRESYTIDVTRIESKITKKTKAVIPVHLYGYPADVEKIIESCEKYGLFLVEDCAQAHGAEYNGKKVGTFGIASAFSFFPSKNLGAIGDAGAVVTNNHDIAEAVRMISNHGQLKARHKHSVIGRNSRLDTIHAAILNVKLPHLDEWNEKRILASKYYISLLSDIEGMTLPKTGFDRKHVFHLFVIRHTNRDKIMKMLAHFNIASSIHYPTPLPFLDAYSYMKHKPEDFPVASAITKEILSLPMYPEISQLQIDCVCDQIFKFG